MKFYPIRLLTFITVTFLISYFIYIFPISYYVSLLQYDIDLKVQALSTVIITVLINTYLQTKITFYPLKFFVYFGMAAGFYGLIISIICFVLSYLFDGSIGVFAMPISLLIILIVGFINTFKIHIKEVMINSSKLNKPYRLAFISDIHLGSQSITHFSKIISQIRNQNIDAILIGGDLIDSSSFNINDLEILKSESVPIFFVTGNHEYYLKDSSEKINKLKEKNIQIIDFKNIDFGDISLVGVGDNATIKEKQSYLQALEVSNKFRIIMVHKPSLWPISESFCDLMLSGHTHAGQMFPFHYLVKLQFPYYYGLYKKNDSYAYVSSGCGCWGPRLRIGSKNEIIILKLEPTNKINNLNN